MTMSGERKFNNKYEHGHGRNEASENSQSHYKPDSDWSYHKTLLVVICVLGSLLVFLFMCKVYLFCKSRSKRHTCQRNGSRGFHNCVCRQQSSNQLITTRDFQAGLYAPPTSAPPNYFSRSPVLCQTVDHLNNLHAARDGLYDNNGHFVSGHTDSVGHSRSMPVINPVYVESLDESDSVYSIDRDVAFGALKDLFKVTERSLTQTVCGKLLVSIARRVDHKGDMLYLDNMGISLYVPEDAIKRGDTKLIVLVLNWDLGDNPKMKKEESLVSPVVYVGPHGLQLEKPCTLTFRHCAFNPNQIQVMRSETELTGRKAWSALCDRADDSGLCYFTPDECQLRVDTFTLYTCVQTPLDECLGKKWLQIAVFACPLRKEINHHQVRIYFLNKTNCALQWAIQNEANFGGKLICPEKVFLFDGNDLDLFTETRYISNGWELVDTENSEKISFLQIWHGQCPHISVCFRRSDSQTSRATSVAIEMSLHVFTFQQTLEESGEKIFIQVFEDDRTPISEHEIRCNHQIDIHINNYGHGTPSCESNHGNHVARNPTGHVGRESMSVSDSCFSSENSDQVKLVINNKFTAFSNQSSNGNITSGEKPRLFPHCLRKRLILLLDPPKTPYGQDWMDLAAKLNLDTCIPKLQTYDNPTSELLNVIENQGKSCSEVISLFREIGREDCVDEIVKYFNKEFSSNQGSSREASENTYGGEQEESHLRSEEYSLTGSSHRDKQSWFSQNSSLNGNSDTFSKETFESKD